MKLDIQAKNLDLTPPLKEYVEDKIGGLERFLRRFEQESILARVEVARTTRHHRHGDVFYAEVNLSLPGGMLRAQANSHDVRVAIGKVKRKLRREIRKYKTTH